MVKMMVAEKYILPGDNETTLSNELAKEIRKRFRRDKENKFQLYLLSAGIREKYLDAATQTYGSEFQEWFASSGVKELFGSLSNFTRYAAAGNAINHVATQFDTPEKYLKRLPVSLRSLYEISKIIKLDAEAFFVCFEFTPTRKNVGDPKHEWKLLDKALIHPHASSVRLASWRERWEQPTTEKQKDKYGRSVKLLSVMVSEDIFGFDEVGNKQGAVDFDEVQKLLDQISALFTKENEKQFKLETELDRIAERYKAEQEKRAPERVLASAKKHRADQYR